jgi:hypothetical protein
MAERIRLAAAIVALFSGLMGLAQNVSNFMLP